MKRGMGLGLAIGLAVTLSWPAPAGAGGIRSKPAAEVEYVSSSKYRKAPKVRGYVARRGGYSYVPEDVINTYGNSRTLYGGANVYRNPMLDRQSPFGPFDHGFFFDSAIMPRGGDAPYQN